MDKHGYVVPKQQKVNGQAWDVVHKLQKVWWANSFADMKFFFIVKELKTTISDQADFVIIEELCT